MLDKFLASSQVLRLTLSWSAVTFSDYRGITCFIEAMVEIAFSLDRFPISDDYNLKKKIKLLTLFWDKETSKECCSL